MHRLFVILALVCGSPAWGYDDLVLPTVDFQASVIHEAGAVRISETIHYSNGKLRIDREGGLSSTILDLTTQTQCILMVNHTYLIGPMDDELFRRYVARTVAANAARKVGKERIEGLETTKYAFGDDGELDVAGFYWLTSAGLMVRREYSEGAFGYTVHHVEYMKNIKFEKQPAALFGVPAGFSPAK